MEALQFTASIPRYAAGRVLGRFTPRAYWGPQSCLSLNEVEPPPLPGPDWVRVDTRYGGICGSDLGVIRLSTSPAASPYSSFPATLGHENVGVVAEGGDRADPALLGRRVVVNPLLPCAVRGFDEPCARCRSGEPNLCERFRDGALSPGTLMGYCRDTGGSWSSSFVAHRSQLSVVPDAVSDENALFAEPFAVALHAVLRHPPPPEGTALVLGAGVAGLATVAALRAVAPGCRILVAARHPAQQAMARRLGADVLLAATRRARFLGEVATQTGGEVVRPIIGPPVVEGGADVVYECVGSGRTLDDALRATRGGGTIVLVGLAAVPRGVDWTPIWMNELRVAGSYCYADEFVDGERISTIDLALRLMAERDVDLSPLLTHCFALADYRHALEAVTNRGASGVIRAAFAFPPRSG